MHLMNNASYVNLLNHTWTVASLCVQQTEGPSELYPQSNRGTPGSFSIFDTKHLGLQDENCSSGDCKKKQKDFQREALKIQ